MEDERRAIERARRELAELSYPSGDVWRLEEQQLESILPSWSTAAELVSLEELGAIPSLDAGTAFGDYLAKFAAKIDDRIRVPPATAVAPAAAPSGSLDDLPASFLDDPASFSLDENWEFVFGEAKASSPAKWEERATSLQSTIDFIEEDLFRRLLQKRSELRSCQGAIAKLKEEVGRLSGGVGAHRVDLRRALDGLGCREAPALSRRRANVQVVIEYLKRMCDVAEAMADIKTVLDDPQASDSEYREVLVHYNDVSESVRDMRGRIAAVDDLLSADGGLTEAIIMEKRHSKLEQLIGDAYREGMAALKAVLRREQWRYVTDLARLEALAARLEETGLVVDVDVDVDGGKLSVDGRRYGVVGSIDALVAVLNELKLFDDKTDVDGGGGDDKINNNVDARTLMVEALRIFNGMTSQLVLGAGAIDSAGLKSITVRTLCIACEQLQLVAAIARQMMIQDSGPRTSHDEFELCVQELEIHSKDIREKIVAVAVELLVPQMKSAAVALGSTMHLASLDEDDGLMPYFKDLVESMVRDFAIVAKLSRSSLCEADADALLENICAEISVWLRDVSARVKHPEVYQRHVRYLHSRLAAVWASPSFDRLLPVDLAVDYKETNGDSSVVGL